MNITDTYQRDGCVLVKNFFSKEECQWLEETIEPIHMLWRKENAVELVKGKWINSHSLTHKKYFSDNQGGKRIEFFNFLASEKIVDILEQLLGKDLFFLNTQLFFNPEGYRKDGYWHRDTQYLGKPEEEQKQLIFKELLVHLHIPLINDDIFEYVPGSHARWDTPEENQIRLERNGHKNSESLRNAKAFPAQVGDAIFFSVHGIHRGRSYESTPKRRTFDVIYGKRYAGVPGFDPDCLPTPVELTGIKHRSLFEF